ncbi:MAG: type IX secretion system membrane protein PorP/SprF [Bacteroidetes bacterium]|nr:type IX secretion system membrane protein PorP/SprF [Bacteroidota bacterium]
MKKIYITIVILIAMVHAMAQQDPSYNMYMFNGLYLNPAYAGSNNVLSMVAMYRHQWVGVNGAPRTFNFSANSPLKRDQYALGLTIADDNLGLTNSFSVTPAFAYRPLVKNVRISIGVQASFTYFSKNAGNAVLNEQYQQDMVTVGGHSLFVPNIGAGIYVNDKDSKRFFVGFSVPHLLPYSLKKSAIENPGNSNVARLYNYYLLTGGYVFGRQAGIVKFTPSVLAMYQQGLPKNIPDFDINAMFIFIDRIKVGASYRTGGDRRIYGESVIGMIEAMITPQLRIGYAYEGGVSKFSSVNSGSHEIMIGYDFWYDKKRFVTPRYGRYF